MIKKIVSSIIILPLLIVPLFCCCFNQASAATVGEEHCQDSKDSHAVDHDKSKSTHSHSCDCSQILSTTGDNLNAAIHSDISFQHKLSFETTSIESFSFSSLKGSMRLAYSGPPIGASSAVPLYTLYHSLRI